MKRVLILANNATGLLSFRREVITALIENGYEPVVSLPPDDRIAEIEALGARVIPTRNLMRRGTNPLRDLRLLAEYNALMRRERPDIVYTYTIKPNIYGGMAAARNGIPYLVNITGLGTAVENPGPLQRLTLALYRRAMRGAATIFFQNTANRDFFASAGIRPDIHTLIPGSGVALQRFPAQPYPTGGKTKFIFISRLMRPKGIDSYFEAARHFGATRSDVEFHILGACEDDYTEVLADMQRQGLVTYHGKQNDVRPFIAAASCLVHPTYYPEGMSNVILEASATGRPVITTDRAGCREAVDDGRTGLLIPERDTNALIDAIQRFLDLPLETRRQMGLDARDKMEREFDRRIVIDTYLRHTADALADHGPTQ